MRTTAWNMVVVENNHQVSFPIKFTLRERKGQLRRLLAVVIDDDAIEEQFEKAYLEGHMESTEPLYNLYVKLRRMSECSEQEALSMMINQFIPRNIKRPRPPVSRYPKGPGR